MLNHAILCLHSTSVRLGQDSSAVCGAASGAAPPNKRMQPTIPHLDFTCVAALARCGFAPDPLALGGTIDEEVFDMQVERIAATVYLVLAAGLLMYGFSAQPRNSVTIAFGGVLLALGANRLRSSSRRGAF